MLTTWGYHDTPTLPDTVELDGVTYERIERLPRNLRPGDLLCLGDNTDRAQYHRAFVIITDVDTYAAHGDRYHWYPPSCTITYRFREADHGGRMARTWGRPQSVFRGDETKEPCTWAYRARK